MKKIVYTLAFLHLTLIAVVIFHGIDDLAKQGPWEKPLAFLCSLNYSVWQYGFFSPDVGKSTEVKIMLHEDGGTTKLLSSCSNFSFLTRNQESLNRFYGFKTRSAQDTLFQDLAARSAVTRLLNVYEDAWRVDYSMSSIQFPKIRDYNPAAPAIDTVEFYSTTFVLR